MATMRPQPERALLRQQRRSSELTRMHNDRGQRYRATGAQHAERPRLRPPAALRLLATDLAVPNLTIALNAHFLTAWFFLCASTPSALKAGLLDDPTLPFGPQTHNAGIFPTPFLVSR